MIEKKELVENVDAVIDALSNLEQTIDVRGAIASGTRFKSALSHALRVPKSKLPEGSQFQLSDDKGLTDEDPVVSNEEELLNEEALSSKDTLHEDVSVKKDKKTKKK